jgi:hypothetical protein
MERGSSSWTLAAFLTAAVAIAGCSTTPLLPGVEERNEAAQAVISNWSDFCRLSASKLIDEYGAPDEIDSSRLVWRDRSLVKRIAVWDVPSEFEADGGAGNVEYTVAYAVPRDKRGALAAFSPDVRVSRDSTELSARSTSEEVNFLAINLADEIIHGIKTPAEARDFFHRTVELSAAGKTSPFMQGLLFLPKPAP